MMERCPCCKARLREAKKCPRCKADLGLIIESEQSAKFCLSQAIRYWQDKNTEQSILALECSLSLKRSKLAEVFHHFIEQKKRRDIVKLLAQKQLLAAKKQLHSVRMLFPYSKQLQQLNLFTDYLLAKSQQSK